MRFAFLKLYFFFDALDAMAFPLILCAFLVGLIIIERGIFFALLARDTKQRDQILDKLIVTLNINRSCDKLVRDEAVSIELSKVSKNLSFGLNILKFSASIAPMLGLLGTILGMIDVFASIASSTTAVSPAMISSGLETAMYATAFGITITVVSMIGFFVYSAIAKSRVSKYASVLNEQNIKIEKENHDRRQSR